MKKFLTHFFSIFFILFVIFFGISNIHAQDSPAGNIPEQPLENTESGNTAVSDTNKNIENNIPGKIEAESTVNNQTPQKALDDKNLNLNKEKKENTKTEQKQPVNPIIPDRQTGNVNELLEINDGDFKYKRIPGISLYKEKIVNENIADVGINPEVKESSDEKEITGLFGFKKSVSDILIKIFLFCLIVGIVIIFKFRSKSHGGHGKVLRRFPGSR